MGKKKAMKHCFRVYVPQSIAGKVEYQLNTRVALSGSCILYVHNRDSTQQALYSQSQVPNKRGS